MNSKLCDLNDDQLRERITELEKELAELKQGHSGAEGNGVVEEPSFGKIFDFPAIGVMRASISGVITDANDTFLNLLGYSREEMRAGELRWDILTPPEFKQLDQEKVKDILTIGRVYPYEKEMTAKDGTRIPIVMAAGRIDAAGDDCFCSVIDLRELKDKEAALKKSEAQFRLLTNAIPQVVFTMNLDGTVEHFNDRYWAMTGLKPTYPNNAWLTTIHPDDLAKVKRFWQKAFSTGEPLEMEVRRKNVEGYRWVLTRAMPLRGESGEIEQWLGTSTDINAQKLILAELEASEERFRTMADAIPQIVWTAHADGSIDFFNHRFFEYSGLSIDQSFDEGWQLLIHPDDLDMYLKRWRQAIEAGVEYELQFRLRRALGMKHHTQAKYRRHLAKVVPWKNARGEVLKWFATWTEIEMDRTNR